jgi:hypothetical protein
MEDLAIRYEEFFSQIISIYFVSLLQPSRQKEYEDVGEWTKV